MYVGDHDVQKVNIHDEGEVHEYVEFVFFENKDSNLEWLKAHLLKVELKPVSYTHLTLPTIYSV